MLKPLLGALALVTLVAAAGAVAPARAQGFLAAYEDLPLAPGLVEVPGTGLSFDGPGGRIVEAYAQGAGPAAEIFRFYAATLPQLGWTRESDSTYRREAEVLTLEAADQGRGLVVRFKISPE